MSVADGYSGPERRVNGDRRRVSELERKFDLFCQEYHADQKALQQDIKVYRMRIEPAITFFELMIHRGLIDLLPKMLDWFDGQLRSGKAGDDRRSLWNSRWARWAAIVGLLYAVMQIALLAMVLMNTTARLHAGG